MGRMPRSGEVIAGRFTIEHLAGSGGMGQVYRARDRRSGRLVALKVMHDAERLELERFAREARILATLSHPGVVRYIDSGTTPEGEPYLVMEWLSGETLSARLQRTHVTLAESLSLGRRVASALGAIHRRGIVHRDLKPSNLFLRNSAIDEVALIDFGMARRPVADPKLTVTGTMLGTPGYVSPEQVYSVSSLDGRADLFSLGCVMYRCLSGRAPFRSHEGLRMLLEGTSDRLPRLRDLRPTLPRALDELVARMLAYSPDDRPHSADAVAAELLAIEESDPRTLGGIGGTRSVQAEKMSAERRLLCLVVARPPERGGAGPVSGADPVELERELRVIVERYRGKLDRLPNGVVLAVVSSADAATDLAARAARCALAIRRLFGGGGGGGGADGAVALVTGREVLGPALPESALLDRALDLLEPQEGAPGERPVRIDELTAALLRQRFDTGASGLHLCGELADPDRPVPPGGPGRPARPGPSAGELVAFVGREQELAQLETIFDQCVEERVASMVLLTGAAGAGKSRLRRELMRRLEARGQGIELWLVEADAQQAGSPFSVIAQVLRRALGLGPDETPEARCAKILARLARHPGGAGAELADRLGELVGARYGDEGGEAGAARQEQTPLSENTRQAFLSFLRVECAARPVVIALEDLHWGDLPSIKLIDAALGALADQPLMVLAIARTELHEIFPRLWADRGVQEIRLRKLPRRACEQLARQVLGDAAEDEALRRLVERSEGHPAFLEELLRAAAAGGPGVETPHSVLAMLQARIERLDPAARRVLRAASIFGETFWRGGVEVLLGGGEAAAWLTELVEQDVVAIEEDGRFPGDLQLRFRHPLVREVAYGMLTESDRVTGHWLAGQWLEQVGEPDSDVIARHYELGDPGRLT